MTYAEHLEAAEKLAKDPADKAVLLRLLSLTKRDQFKQDYLADAEDWESIAKVADEQQQDAEDRHMAGPSEGPFCDYLYEVRAGK